MLVKEANTVTLLLHMKILNITNIIEGWIKALCKLKVFINLGVHMNC